MRFPWLVVWTLIGAFLGAFLAPAVAGGLRARDKAEKTTATFILGGAIIGLGVGVVVDFSKRQDRR